MKTIVIGFSKAKSDWYIGSDLIMWFLDKPFSHTFFMFKEDLFDDWTINQASGHGINYLAEKTFLINNEIVSTFNLEISDELYVRILQDCHTFAGFKYGYLTNIGILITRMLSKIRINLKRNPIPDGINCSGWMYRILEEVYGKWTDEDPNLITPDDIYEFLQSKNLPEDINV